MTWLAHKNEGVLQPPTSGSGFNASSADIGLRTSFIGPGFSASFVVIDNPSKLEPRVLKVP